MTDNHPSLEQDLLSCSWLVEKVKCSTIYAQNLYAALCNNEFQKLEVVPILTEKKWSCSWRYAGGIVADLRCEGDYIDWYCSGINYSFISDEEHTLSNTVYNNNDYVSEGVITEEIHNDLLKLRWKAIDETDV
jgi:hypothetical protein